MFEKVVVIDCRGHLLGRLASIVAKELLCGQKVVCVRTEEVNVSGSLYRNQTKFHEFLNKKRNTNPRRGGPVHFRSPSRMLWRTIRGMLPHKTARGTAAMARLKTLEGIPPPFDKMKRMVVPKALRVLQLRPGRDFCKLGDLAHAVGWKHRDLVERLESQRKIHSDAFYQSKKAAAKAVREATA